MSNIYRRGHVFWWRRRVASPKFGKSPILVRVSLKTADLHEAKSRAAMLETEFCVVLRNVERELKGSLDREGMKAVFHEAAKSSLDRYLMRQAERPWDTEHHALANARHAEYFTLIAEQEKMPHAGSTMEKRLAESGFEDDEIYSIMNIAFAYDESNPAISHRYIAEYLTRAGINPSVRNLQASLRVVAAGYREACIEANRRIGISDTHVDPLPPAMAAMLDLPVVAQFPKSEAAGVGKVDSSQGV